MTGVFGSPPAPVGQQGPPARAVASAMGGTPRRARVPPADYRDVLATLDLTHRRLTLQR
jgi:hypothetical protein